MRVEIKKNIVHELNAEQLHINYVANCIQEACWQWFIFLIDLEWYNILTGHI